jgi:hypothetical protein
MREREAEYDTSDPDRLYWDEHVSRGLELRQKADGVQWELGALALTIETTYGKGDLAKFAEAIGVPAKSLAEYRWVVSQFSARAENVPFTAYRMLASRADRAKWLARYIQKGWSTRDLQRELDMASAAAERVPRPLRETQPPPRFRTVEGFDGWYRNQSASLAWVNMQFESPDSTAYLKPDQRGKLRSAADEVIEFWTHLRDRLDSEDGVGIDTTSAYEEDGITREAFME